MALAKQILRFVEKLRTTENDTQKVLRPDGSGGVSFDDVPPAPASWGGITGTVSDQTDLQGELNAKEDNIPTGTTSDYIRGDKSLNTLDQVAVGLDQVDNTADTDKPISTATQTALDTKADDASIHPLGKSGNLNDAIVPGGSAIGNTIFRDTLSTWLERLIQMADVVGLASALGLKADQTSLDTHTNNVSNPHNVTTNQLNLQNVDNTSDVDKPVSTATNTALDLKQDLSEKGQANGYCELDSSSMVPANRISVTGLNPRGTWNADTNTPFLSDSGGGGVTNDFFIVNVAGSTSLDGISTWNVGDEVLNANNVWNRIPSTQTVSTVHGRTGAVVSASGDYDADQIDETTGNKIMTSTERTAITTNTAHITSDGSSHSGVVANTNHRTTVTGNPHNVTKTDLSIENVDNTSDLNKPVSTATQSALDTKADSSDNLNFFNDVTYLSPVNGEVLKRVGGSWSNDQLDASDVGLGNVDNTSDLDKPISTDTQTALDLKADGTDLSSHTSNVANPHVVTKAQVGLGNVDNTSDVDKPISTATQTALDLKADDLDLTNHTADVANPHVVTQTQVGLGNVDNTSDIDKPISTDTQAALDAKSDIIYDGTEDLASTIIAKDPTTFIGQTWWARDVKNGYEAVNSNITGTPTDVWQAVTAEYDSETDSFRTPTNQAGVTGNLNEESWVNAVNDTITTVTTLEPKVFKLTNSVSGEEKFTNAVLVTASDVVDGEIIGVNTNSATAGGKFKLLRDGLANDVKTDQWAVNSVLYIDPTTPGELTTVKPTISARAIAKVNKSDATTGILFVSPTDQLDSSFVPIGFDRVWFTGQVITPIATDFYEALRGDEGSVLEATEVVSVPDDSTVGIGQDHVGVVSAQGSVISSGEFRGQVEFEQDTGGGQEKIHMEVYDSDGDGVPVDSGILTEPVGDLGVRPIFRLESALFDADTGVIILAEMIGSVDEDYTVIIGNRLRSHILCEKVGSAGATKDFTIYFGSDHATFIDAPQQITSDDVLNDSDVTGGTVTDALNQGLNAGGLWTDGLTHKKNYIFRDGAWAGWPTVDTTDRLAPQDIGTSEGSVDKLGFVTASNTSRVEMVHRFTATKSGYTQALEILTPNWDTDSISRVSIFNQTTGEVKIVDNPILTSGEFTIIGIGTTLFTIGDVFIVSFEFYNSSAANAIDGGWTSLLGAGVPASQGFTIDNLNTPTIVEISHTDLDSDDRSTELDGVVSGSIIRITETADVSRNIEFEVDTVDTVSATSTAYTVLVGSIDNGERDIRSVRACSIHIDVPISQPTEYSVDAGFYPAGNPSWATITTELYYDGVLQVGSVDAFGINVTFQEASLSDDWFILAASLSSGGGGGSVTASPRYEFPADTLENPINSDWAVNALSPVDIDSSNNGLTIRTFNDTTEQGVGFTVVAPSDASNISIAIKSRAQTAPGSAQTVAVTLYNRGMPDNAAIESWSSAFQMDNVDIPNNAFYQDDSQTIPFATLGVTAGEETQFELTRDTADGGDTLTGDWNLKSIVITFS